MARPVSGVAAAEEMNVKADVQQQQQPAAMEKNEGGGTGGVASRSGSGNKLTSDNGKLKESNVSTKASGSSGAEGNVVEEDVLAEIYLQGVDTLRSPLLDVNVGDGPMFPFKYCLEQTWLVWLRVIGSLPFLDYIQTMVFAIVLSGLNLALALAWFVFRQVVPSLGFKFVTQELSTVSQINWATPELMLKNDDPFVKEQMTKAFEAMSSPPPARATEGFPIRENSISVATILMSSAMYECQQTDKALHEVMRGYKKTGNRVPILQYRQTIEAVTRTFASLHDMDFTTIAETGECGGLTCGVFVPRKHNFVVVAFKGTTPDNFKEWLVDASLSRCHGGCYVGGEVHRGFFRYLFSSATQRHPTQGGTAGRLFGTNVISWELNNEQSPYSRIIDAMKHVIRYIAGRQKSAGKDATVNVWVTGHSLGAALAGLFFARLLNSESDLDVEGCEVRIRDGYVYGCPRIGDWRFASNFFANCRMPIRGCSRLWRIVNDKDIVCRVPLGISNDDVASMVGQDALVNYVHIGQAKMVKISHMGIDHPLRRYTSNSLGEIAVALCQIAKEYGRLVFYTVVNSDKIKELREEWSGDVGRLERVLPHLILDHFPNRYFYALKEHIEDHEKKSFKARSTPTPISLQQQAGNFVQDVSIKVGNAVMPKVFEHTM